MEYYLYILASKKNGTLYTGLTNNLKKRVWEHKQNLVPGFTKKYNVHHLAYFEKFHDVYSAIAREKRIKKWKRQWKINLIEQMNPDWNDLYDNFDSCLSVGGVESDSNTGQCHSCGSRNPDINFQKNEN